MKQLDEYNIFNDLGKNWIHPYGHNKTKVHLISDIKHDTRHKARLIANGNLTEVLIDSVYSGVVSVRGLCMIIFLAKLNQFDI